MYSHLNNKNMTKMKELYRSKVHTKDKSHDVIILKPTVPGEHSQIKLKMTYRSYNANEEFHGESWFNGKWEHTFNMLDLGVVPESISYIWDDKKRLSRCEDLIKKGIEYFKILGS